MTPDGGRHVRGQPRGSGAIAGAGITLGLLLLGAFVLLSFAVLAGLTQRFDEAVLLQVATHRSPILDYVMTRLTTLGAGVVLLMVVLVSATFLWLTNHRWSAFVLTAGVVGGIVFNNLLKLVFARPRPEVVEGMDAVVSLSFPSGHAMSSIIVYGSVAWIVSTLESTNRMRAATWAIATVFIFGIGYSRMYLGVHYPTDVIAGFLAGAAWVAFVASSERAARFFGGEGERQVSPGGPEGPE